MLFQALRNTFSNLLAVFAIGMIALLTSSYVIADEPVLIDPESLYDHDRVSKIEITLDPKDWNELRLQRREFVDSMLSPSVTSFDNFRASIRINGVEVPDVAIRKKGFFGSLDDNFPSLKIKLDEFVKQSPMGSVKRLTLNNNKQDASLLSQFMAYRLFNDVGVQAPRVGFAVVFVNDAPLGVYSVVETVDKPFLASRFNSSSGDLLEGTLADFSSKSIRRLDLKSGENKESHQWKVNELSKLLEAETLDLEKLDGLVDMKCFYRFWATESLLAFWDGYSANQNNYFVYDDPKTQRLHFMPWGADSLWSSMSGPFGGFAKPIDSVYANALLTHKLFQTKEGRESYRQTMNSILEEYWDEEAMKTKIDEIAGVLQPYLHPRQMGSLQARKEMKRFIDGRRSRIARELDKWPVTVPEKPRRPMYSVEVGVASGDFSTFFQRIPKGSESSGAISLQMDNKTIELRDLKIIAKRFSMGFMSFGAAPESLPPTVEISGKSSSGEKYVLTLSFDNKDFLKQTDGENAAVSVRGSINQGGGSGSPMGGANSRWIQGTCEFQEAETSSGSPVVGKFQVKVYRLVGGFFGG